MSVALWSVDSGAIEALLLREFRAALINRYFQVFGGLSLIGGVAATLLSEDGNAIAFWIVQMALYVVSLFALLAGLSSAQGERSEWQLLFAQPVPRRTFVLAKFVAYLSIFAVVLGLLFIPAAIGASRSQPIGVLYLQTFLLSATCLALGLTIGFFAHDRAQALIAGVGIWFLLLVMIDFVALFAARFELIQSYPDVWVAMLMLNPLDAFRIHALFALEQIPPEAANKTALAGWWISHAGIWFTMLALFWSALLLAVASRHLNRREE